MPWGYEFTSVGPKGMAVLDCERVSFPRRCQASHDSIVLGAWHTPGKDTTGQRMTGEQASTGSQRHACHHHSLTCGSRFLTWQRR